MTATLHNLSAPVCIWISRFYLIFASIVPNILRLGATPRSLLNTFRPFLPKALAPDLRKYESRTIGLR